MIENPDILTLFNDALSKASLDERVKFLDSACGQDHGLRMRLDHLLRAHEDAGGFLGGAEATWEPLGATIGPYMLLEQIGVGGFGVVFLAEQMKPIRRRVALKLVKPGMDTRQVLARFEAERQALAIMDHPGIAKVLDAGVTDRGRSYFVMELVQGVPINEYCDQCGLSTRGRLSLFIAVCQAVQHAHQKGIIHRDLKPTNVLVTMQDGRPAPKIIDFGIAKAIEQRLTDNTITTGFAPMVGTPLYMSPEQAEQSPQGVDTRADIYSLGVLLYELLTGTTPFDKDRLHAASYHELRRIIRDEEPPRPSARLTTLAGNRATTIAERCRTDYKRLMQSVRGDLDWIVMKCLEKDRNRRYDSASSLAEDLQRFLRDEPVLARPPSISYRFGRFTRRNIAAVGVALALLLATLVGVGSLGWAVRDRAARAEQAAQDLAARRAKASGQLELILEDVSRLEAAEKWHEAMFAAKRAEPMLEYGAANPDIQNRARRVLEDLQLVLKLDEIRAGSATVWGPDILGSESRAIQADLEYVEAFRAAGIEVDAPPWSEVSRLLKERHAVTAALMPAIDDWIAVRSKLTDQSAAQRLVEIQRAADPDPWRQNVRDCIRNKDWSAIQVLVKADDLARQPAATLCFLAASLQWTDQHSLAVEVLRQAQWNSPADYWINHRLGVHLIWLQSPQSVEEGIGFMRAAIAVRPRSSHPHLNLGNGYLFLGRRDHAIACYRRAIELTPGSGEAFGNLGIALSEMDQCEEAIVSLERALQLNPKCAAQLKCELSLLHCNHLDSLQRDVKKGLALARSGIELEPSYANNWTALGIAYYRRGQWQDACEAFDKSLQSNNWSTGGAVAWNEAIHWFFRAMTLHKLGKLDESRACYAKAVAAVEANPTPSKQLLRLREESEAMLDIELPLPVTIPAGSR